MQIWLVTRYIVSCAICFTMAIIWHLYQRAQDRLREQCELDNVLPLTVSRTKHIWYSEHGMYCRFEIILERAMSVTHVAVILRTRTSPAYEEEFMKMDYPDARNGYGTS